MYEGEISFLPIRTGMWSHLHGNKATKGVAVNDHNKKDMRGDIPHGAQVNDPEDQKAWGAGGIGNVGAGERRVQDSEQGAQGGGELER